MKRRINIIHVYKDTEVLKKKIKKAVENASYHSKLKPFRVQFSNQWLQSTRYHQVEEGNMNK